MSVLLSPFMDGRRLAPSAAGAIAGPRMVVRFEDLPYQHLLELVESNEQQLEVAIPLPPAMTDVFALLDEMIQAENRKHRETFTLVPSTLGILRTHPLSPDFRGWTSAATIVHTWLDNNAVSNNTHEWRWGVNLFWIAYLAATPGFPFAGRNPEIPWNPRLIPLLCERTYIAQMDKTANPVDAWEEWMKVREHWVERGVWSLEWYSRVEKFNEDSDN